MQKIIYSLIIALIISVGAAVLDQNITNELQNNIIRLHIIANSDSEHDQTIKLKVRDSIIKNVRLDDIDFVEKAGIEANKILIENNEDYRAYASFEKFYFPTKTYENITLPQGEYYSVRLKLGNASGKNWWCIMYPPLCSVSDNNFSINQQSNSLLQDSLSPQSYETITSKEDKVKVRFKVVEIIENIKSKIS